MYNNKLSIMPTEKYFIFESHKNVRLHLFGIMTTDFYHVNGLLDV